MCPILDYAAELWSFRDFSKIDSIQNRAQHVFLGVHNFAPNAAVSGDTGLTLSPLPYVERLLSKDFGIYY